MNVPKIIVFFMLLIGCKSSTNSFEPKSFASQTSELFFNASTGSTYDNLIDFFKTVKGLKEVENGWTIYPPLSALHQAQNNITQKTFEFQKYLALSAGFKNGTLVVRKLKSHKDPLAVLEINLAFKSENDVKAFYEEIVHTFKEFRFSKEESNFELENIRLTIYRDIVTSSVLTISVFSDKDEGLFSVTLNLVPGES